MDDTRKLERLRKSGMLASWQWSQAEWDQIARFYSGRNFSWGTALKVGIWPMIAIALMTSERNWFSRSTPPKEIPTANAIPPNSALAIFIGCALFFWWSYRWFHTSYFPTPRIGHKPEVIVSKEGVKLGRSFFFLEPPALRLAEVVLVKPKTDGEPHAIQMNVVWGFGVGKVIIPVPSDKVSEAEQVVTTLKSTILAET